MQVLQTERLVLSQLTTGDAAFLLELLNSPGWLKYIGDRGVKTIEDAEKYVQEGPMKSYRENGFGLYRVSLKTDGTVLGICGLIKRKQLEDVDIGFAFLPSFAGKGYAYESASATLAFGREQFGLKKIVAIITQDNDASIKLVLKLGLRFSKMIDWPGEERPLMLFTT